METVPKLFIRKVRYGITLLSLVYRQKRLKCVENSSTIFRFFIINEILIKIDWPIPREYLHSPKKENPLWHECWRIRYYESNVPIKNMIVSYIIGMRRNVDSISDAYNLTIIRSHNHMRHHSHFSGQALSRHTQILAQYWPIFKIYIILKIKIQKIVVAFLTQTNLFYLHTRGDTIIIGHSV